MKRIIGISMSAAVLLLVGCGSTSTFSCDLSSGMSKQCLDYVDVSGDVGPTQAGCTKSGGTIGMVCPRAGIVGGCRITAPAGESGTVTTWYYSGTADMVMASCTGTKMYVSP